MRLPLGLAGAAALCLGVSAVGVSADANDTGQQADAVVEMTSTLDYSPAELTIRVGDTVEWRNTSIMDHTVTADRTLANDPSNVKLPEGAEPFNSGSIPPGESYRRTFTAPGEYRYFCIPHEQQGMVASLTVLPAGS